MWDVDCGLSDYCANSRVSQWLYCQVPRTTPQEALIRQLDLGSDPEDCYEVSLTGALTASTMDPVSDTGGLLFCIFLNDFLPRWSSGCKRDC